MAVQVQEQPEPRPEHADASAQDGAESEAPVAGRVDVEKARGPESTAAAAGASTVPTMGWRSVLCQCLSALALMCQTLAQGLSQGWSSPGVAKLRKGEGPFTPTEDQITWIVSLFELGQFTGSVVSWMVFTRLGRRHTLAVGPVAFLLWVLLTYYATSAEYLYAARLLAGVGMGVNFTFSSIYLGEMATPLMRSVLILIMTLLAPSGQLLSFIIGPYLDYWWEALSPLPLIAAALVLHLVCTRESPFFLVMKDRHEDAEKVLFQLRRGHDATAVHDELDKIKRSVHQQLTESRSWRETLAPPGVKRASLIVLVLSGSPALFGVTTVLSFTQRIFEEAEAPLPVASSILTIGVKVVMVVLSMYLVERLGRRVQLSTTAFICFLSMAAMSVYFLCKENLHMDMTGAKWVPLVALLSFMASIGAGVIPVSHILQGELLSQRAKMTVAPVAAMLLAASSFGVQQAFARVGKLVGYFLPFGIYALTNLFIAIFTIYVVPETRRRTLMEVQEDLRARATRSSSAVSRKALLQHQEPPHRDQGQGQGQGQGL